MVDVAPDRDISISYRETVETKMRKRVRLIDSRPTLKMLGHTERTQLIGKLHRLDKMLSNKEIKNITELNDTVGKWQVPPSSCI